jgi:hypothetical protein
MYDGWGTWFTGEVNFEDLAVRSIFIRNDAVNGGEGVRLSQLNSLLADYLPRVGVTDGSNAPAGCVGEFFSAVGTQFNATGVMAQQFADTIALPAGDWDVVWVVRISSLDAQQVTFHAHPVTGFAMTSTTPGGLPSPGSGYVGGATIVGIAAASNMNGIFIPQFRVSSTTGSLTLTFTIGFGIAPTTACGVRFFVTARRMR